MNLTILVLASEEDGAIVDTLAAIAKHDLLRPFVVLHVDGRCEYIDKSLREDRDLWNLVAEFRLDVVKILRVSCGGLPLTGVDTEKIDGLRRRFVSGMIRVVVGTLVAPLFGEMVSENAFQPFWDINAILEPQDAAGEAQFISMDLKDRNRQVMLAAAAVALIGGLWLWLTAGPLDDIESHVQGNQQRIRLMRVVTRLVDAGDLTARAVSWALSPGAQLPPPPGCVRHGATYQAVNDMLDVLTPTAGVSPLGFSYDHLPNPVPPERKRLGIWATIRLYLHEVYAEIRKLPREAIERGVTHVITRLEEAVTNKTFGSDSDIIVKLTDPKTLDLALNGRQRLAQVQQLANMGPLASTPSALTWGWLVEAVLASADGDDMPSGLQAAQPMWAGDRAVIADHAMLVPRQLAEMEEPGFVLTTADLRAISWDDRAPVVIHPTDVVAIDAVMWQLDSQEGTAVGEPTPEAPSQSVEAPPSPARPATSQEAAAEATVSEAISSRGELRKRLDTWRRPYEGCLLLGLVQRIAVHQQQALIDIGALDTQLGGLLAEMKKASDDSAKGRRKFVRRFLIALLVIVLLVAMCVFGFMIVSTVVGIVLAGVAFIAVLAGLGSIYRTGKKRVRDKHRLDELADRPAQLMAQRQHAAEEYARLCDVYDVYHDWARVIAAAIHRPWGTVDTQAISPWVTSTGTLSFISGEPSISQDEMTRTSLGLAQAVAKRGWLSSAYRERRDGLVESYRRTTAGVAGTEKDPELDYTDSEVLTALDAGEGLPPVEIYGPRTHFLYSYVNGDLADTYRGTQIDRLRLSVETNDPSAMIKEVRCDVRDLTGRTAGAFLRPIVEWPALPSFGNMVADPALVLGKVTTNSWCGISSSIEGVQIPVGRQRTVLADLAARFVLAAFRLDLTDPLSPSDLRFVTSIETYAPPRPDDAGSPNGAPTVSRS